MDSQKLSKHIQIHRKVENYHHCFIALTLEKKHVSAVKIFKGGDKGYKKLGIMVQMCTYQSSWLD